MHVWHTYKKGKGRRKNSKLQKDWFQGRHMEVLEALRTKWRISTAVSGGTEDEMTKFLYLEYSPKIYR